MATNGESTTSQQLIPIFNGEKYEFWSIKMKTLFKSQELWDLVEKGYAEEDEAQRLRENKKKDSKALFYIQQAMHDSIFFQNYCCRNLKAGMGYSEKRIPQLYKAAIEESHDLSNYGFDELMSSLQAHEDRQNASQEKGEEKAFQIKGESSFKGKSEVSNARGYRGRGSFRGRGRGKGNFLGRGRGRG
ncbi:hypothetical protein KY289_026227 [Solanum tuberosum]|nr:hypothetical protein KY289_026227 [Solanum tuberosum]